MYIFADLSSSPSNSALLSAIDARLANISRFVMSVPEGSLPLIGESGSMKPMTFPSASSKVR